MACRDESAFQEHEPWTMQLLTSPYNRVFKNLNSLKGMKSPNYVPILVVDGPHVF